MTIEDVCLVGSGNVGHHLGLQLYRRGIFIRQVFSREVEKARSLARLLNADWTGELEKVKRGVDCYILAVSDEAIDRVAEALSHVLEPNALVVHTSGATPSSVLANSFHNFGVFYPLQSFSIDREVNFLKVPICIYSPDKDKEDSLKELAQKISDSVYRIEDKDRKKLHLAAVFVNNFVNHLYQTGYELTEANGLNFNILRPLILETAQKVMDHPPLKMQTGPAGRNDMATIERHLQMLEEHPNLGEIYRLLTKSINPEIKL